MGAIPLKSSILLLDFSFTIQLLGYPHNLGNHQAFQVFPGPTCWTFDLKRLTKFNGKARATTRGHGGQAEITWGAGLVEQLEMKKTINFWGDLEDLFISFHGFFMDFWWDFIGFHLVRKVQN